MNATITVKIKNLYEFHSLSNDVKQKTSELQEAIQRLNDFEFELETESASNH